MKYALIGCGILYADRMEALSKPAEPGFGREEK